MLKNISGIVIYAFYGVHHSKENKPLSAYNQVLSYGGDGETIGPHLEEKIHHPQPNQGLRNDGADSFIDD